MKRLISVTFALILLFASCATGASENDRPEAEPFYSFTDSLGREVKLDAAPERVVSLFGSYAETWLLAGGTLAGTTQDAIEERGLELGGSAAVVGTVKTPDTEALLALEPDFVLLSTDVTKQLDLEDTLEKAGISCAYFKVEFFDDYLNMLKICTDITGRSDLYEQNGLAVQEQIASALQAAEGRVSPTVLFIRAYSGGAKAKREDNMTGEMLRGLGCDNIAARHDSLLEELSMEEILLEDPDFIFITTMGDEGEALEALRGGIQSNPAWASLTAVKNGRCIVLPKEMFHYKPNNRWGDAYEYLAGILYGYAAQ